MRLPAKDRLTDEEIQSGLRTVIKDGLASQAMATLTMGVFLVAFALKLGASNTDFAAHFVRPNASHFEPRKS